MAKILIVEDEAIVAHVVRDALESVGHTVRWTEDGDAALRIVAEWDPRLVILDLGLATERTGLSVCQRLRADPRTAGILLVILTGAPGTAVEAELFDAGADAYVRKDRFTPSGLRGRVDALLRRAECPEPGERVEVGPLALHVSRRQGVLEGRDLGLTPGEFDLLRRLARAGDKVLSRQELLGASSPVENPATTRAVDMHVKQLRKKLGEHAAMIRTVYGRGYQLVVPTFAGE